MRLSLRRSLAAAALPVALAATSLPSRGRAEPEPRRPSLLLADAQPAGAPPSPPPSPPSPSQQPTPSPSQQPAQSPSQQPAQSPSPPSPPAGSPSAPSESPAPGAERRARARASVAVLWLDPPSERRQSNGPGGAPFWRDRATPSLDVVEAIQRGLEQSKAVRPIDDAELRRRLVEGGPVTRVALALDAAVAGSVERSPAETNAALAEAEAIALRELPVSLLTDEQQPLLGQIESLRAVSAELAGDEAAIARARHLLAAAHSTPMPGAAAVLARHPAFYGPSAPASSVRVESEPSGAAVYVDLAPACTTPCDLPPSRSSDALVDVELQGYRKAHREAPAAGTLAIALAREDGVGAAIDRLRLATGELAANDLAVLGALVAADRLLVARPSGAGRIEARVLDVKSARWAGPAAAFATTPSAELLALGPRVAAFAEPPRPAPKPVAKAVAPAEEKKDSTPTFLGKKWYTWAIGAALAAGVIGLVVAEHVGDDQLTVHLTH